MQCMQTHFPHPVTPSFESPHSRAMGSHCLECSVMYSAVLREKCFLKQSSSAWLLMVLLLSQSLLKEVIVMWDMKLQTSYQQSSSTNAINSSFTSTSQSWYSDILVLFGRLGWMLVFFSLLCLSFLLSSSLGVFSLSWAGICRRALAAVELSGAAYPSQEMSSPNCCFPLRRCDKISARGLAHH